MKHDKKIAVGTSKGTIVSINLNDYMDGLRELKSYRTVKKVHELSINAMRMNRRGDWIITGDKGGTVKYFKTKILYENQQVPKNVQFYLKKIIYLFLEYRRPPKTSGGCERYCFQSELSQIFDMQ